MLNMGGKHWFKCRLAWRVFKISPSKARYDNSCVCVHVCVRVCVYLGVGGIQMT